MSRHSLQIVPLGEEHLDAAAALVARRFARLHAQEPLLPARYSEPSAFLPLLKGLSSTKDPGVAALRDGRLAGFLTGWRMPDFRGQKSTYSPEWANGAEPGASRTLYEELYRRLSAEWASEGYVAHYVSVFPNEPGALEALHWLGFGMHSVDAVRGLDPISTADPGIEVRRAGMADLDALLELDEGLYRHIRGAPIFLPRERNTRAEWEGWLADPRRPTWIAVVQGDPVALISLGPANEDVSTIIVDEGTTSVYLAFARPDVRGRGIATTVLDRALRHASAVGYRRCAVDFESANPDGARFWCRYFKPICLSLLRQIACP